MSGVKTFIFSTLIILVFVGGIYSLNKFTSAKFKIQEAMKDVNYHDDNSITFKDSFNEITFTPAEVSNLNDMFEKADKIADICEKNMKTDYVITLGSINGKTISYVYNPENYSLKSMITVVYNNYKGEIGEKYIDNDIKKLFNQQVLIFRNNKFTDFFGVCKDKYIKQHVKELKAMKKVEDILKPSVKI
jgi:hypothetical protein